MSGLGFGVWGLGFGVWGYGFEVSGFGFRVSVSGFQVVGFFFRGEVRTTSHGGYLAVFVQAQNQQVPPYDVVHTSPRKRKGYLAVFVGETLLCSCKRKTRRSPRQNLSESEANETPVARISCFQCLHGCRVLHRNVQRFRGGLVLKAHRLLYHSTLGLRVINKKRKKKKKKKKKGPG